MGLILDTARLRLRAPTLDDLGAIVAGLNDFAVARYLTRVPFPYAEADGRDWLAMLAPPRLGNAHFAIERREQPGLLGVVGLESELGFWLSPAAHGQGLMTEACFAVLDWHFSGLPEAEVPSSAHLGNTASLNVQHKLGFVETGETSLRHARSHGRDIVHVETRLTRPAFVAARARREGH